MTAADHGGQDQRRASGEQQPPVDRVGDPDRPATPSGRGSGPACVVVAAPPSRRSRRPVGAATGAMGAERGLGRWSVMRRSS